MGEIDLSQYPVVDDHCHPFLPEKERKPFIKNFNFAGIPIPEDQIENLISYRRAMANLAKMLGSPMDFGEIIKRRETEYDKQPAEYIRKLFKDANLDTLIFDMGYPAEEYPGGYSIDPDEFRELTQIPGMEYVYRIERLIYNLSQKDLSFDEMLDKYLESLKKAVKEEGYIGFKSIIAYGYGIPSEDPDIDDARKIYDKLQKNGKWRLGLVDKDMKTLREERVVREFLFCRAAEKSIEFHIPFHLHTSLGESDILDLLAANPLHLYPILKDKNLGRTKFVFLHVYPYYQEAGYLANQYPNVYIDTSLAFRPGGIGPHIALKNAILQEMEMTPMNKILYGSDAGDYPESFWLSAIWFKRALSDVLTDLVKSQDVDEDYAYKIGRMILYENVKRLHHL
jgi:predicted TIM-barrel fold metal-dependent hydrolase